MRLQMGTEEVIPELGAKRTCCSGGRVEYLLQT
jgi:DNA-directed RNA polymerase subunit N (RpoN/RPB10)